MMFSQNNYFALGILYLKFCLFHNTILLFVFNICTKLFMKTV